MKTRTTFLWPDSMGKRGPVHTFIAAVHASRCFAHLTRGCILPAREMFLDLSEPHRAPDRIRLARRMFIDLFGVCSIAGHTLPTGRMFLDLSWLYLSPQPHSAQLKNVHRPIRDSGQLRVAFCQDEKCSWSYPGTRPPPGSILSNNAPGNRYCVGVLCVLPVL
jgi:hypothetical protein